MDRNQTDKILMKDEKVLYTFKPNLTVIVVRTIVIFLIIMALTALAYLIPDEEGEVISVVVGVSVVLGIMALIFILTIIGKILAFQNRFYVVTNKRFIIQKGLFGIDFSSIPIPAAQFISVNVSVLDKILQKGTGSITFGTVSTPVSGSQPATFVFGDLPNVYENYRMFKEIIDNGPTQETN
ncbi:MAG: PH domain-containing protein [Acholeplasmataceae bacterium]|jgi:membrane protein YdbS with pleckstrin-like domain